MFGNTSTGSTRFGPNVLKRLVHSSAMQWGHPMTLPMWPATHCQLFCQESWNNISFPILSGWHPSLKEIFWKQNLGYYFIVVSLLDLIRTGIHTAVFQLAALHFLNWEWIEPSWTSQFGFLHQTALPICGWWVCVPVWPSTGTLWGVVPKTLQSIMFFPPWCWKAHAKQYLLGETCFR